MIDIWYTFTFPGVPARILPTSLPLARLAEDRLETLTALMTGETGMWGGGGGQPGVPAPALSSGRRTGLIRPGPGLETGAPPESLDQDLWKDPRKAGDLDPGQSPHQKQGFLDVQEVNPEHHEKEEIPGLCRGLESLNADLDLIVAGPDPCLEETEGLDLGAEDAEFIACSLKPFCFMIWKFEIQSQVKT